ncbi:MAG: helix-turn-helix domain-containing protein [Myxococcota bacterium]
MTRRRGRPRREEGTVISREALLEVAARVIGAKGFAGASIRAIAKAAGVSYGTVQHRFPTKHDLFKAIVDDVLVPLVERPPPVSSTFGGVLKARILDRLEGSVLRPGLSVAILSDRSEGAHARRAYLVNATAESRERELKRMGALQQAGLMREFDLRALLVLMGLAVSCISSLGPAVKELVDIDLEDSEQREALAASLADLLLYGILPRA